MAHSDRQKRLAYHPFQESDLDLHRQLTRIAQMGERQAADLEVRVSNPVQVRIFLLKSELGDDIEDEWIRVNDLLWYND